MCINYKLVTVGSNRKISLIASGRSNELVNWLIFISGFFLKFRKTWELIYYGFIDPLSRNPQNFTDSLYSLTPGFFKTFDRTPLEKCFDDGLIEY